MKHFHEIPAQRPVFTCGLDLDITARRRDPLLAFLSAPHRKVQGSMKQNNRNKNTLFTSSFVLLSNHILWRICFNLVNDSCIGILTQSQHHTNTIHPLTDSPFTSLHPLHIPLQSYHFTSHTSHPMAVLSFNSLHITHFTSHVSPLISLHTLNILCQSSHLLHFTLHPMAVLSLTSLHTLHIPWQSSHFTSHPKPATTT